MDAVRNLAQSGLDVFAHNIETVASLQVCISVPFINCDVRMQGCCMHMNSCTARTANEAHIVVQARKERNMPVILLAGFVFVALCSAVLYCAVIITGYQVYALGLLSEIMHHTCPDCHVV